MCELWCFAAAAAVAAVAAATAAAATAAFCFAVLQLLLCSFAAAGAGATFLLCCFCWLLASANKKILTSTFHPPPSPQVLIFSTALDGLFLSLLELCLCSWTLYGI